MCCTCTGSLTWWTGGVLVVSALNVGHMGLLSVVRLRGLVGRLVVGLHCLVLHNGN